MADPRQETPQIGALLSGGLAALCAFGWHHFNNPQTEGIAWVLGLLAVLFGFKFLGAMGERAEDIHSRVRGLRKKSTHGGTAHLMTKKDAVSAGMTDPKGVPLGTKDGKLIRDANSAHACWFLPTGFGKTIGPIMLIAAHCITSEDWDLVIVNDPKPEAGVMLKPLCEAHGVAFHSINASGRFEDLMGKSSWNPCQVALDVVDKGRPSLLEHCDATNGLMIKVDRNGEDKNAWWKRTGIRDISSPQAYWALTDRDRCNYAEILRVLSDPLENAKLLDEMAGREDLLNGDLAARAKTLLALSISDPKNYGSSLDEAVTALQMFGKSGSIAGVSSKTSIDLNQKSLITLSNDMTLVDSQSQFASLVMMTIMRASMLRDRPLRIKILYDEAAFSPCHNLSDIFVIARGAGASLEVFWQTVGDAKRILGENAFDGMMGNCDRKVYGGFTDPKAASEFAQGLGETGILKETYRQDGNRLVRNYSHEKSQIVSGFGLRTMEKGKMVALIGNNPAIELDHLSYAEVDPWCRQIRHSIWHDKPLKMKTRVKV